MQIKKNKLVLNKLHSNRRESIYWENKLGQSLDGWEKVKQEQMKTLEKQQLEQDFKKRQEEVKLEKQKIYFLNKKEQEKKEFELFDKKAILDEKIKQKKRIEIKKRDLIYRNKNNLG